MLMRKENGMTIQACVIYSTQNKICYIKLGMDMLIIPQHCNACGLPDNCITNTETRWWSLLAKSKNEDGVSSQRASVYFKAEFHTFLINYSYFYLKTIMNKWLTEGHDFTKT